MSNVMQYFQQAELALAAYSDLNGQMTLEAYKVALQQDGNGMTLTQAENFASQWRVVDQYDGMVEETYFDEFGQEHKILNPTGLSATVFENVDGQRYLAIRGTQPSDLNDLITDVIDIGALGTAEFQAQYAALSAQVQTWLDDGVLQSGFTVAGHSLGGFLATNLALHFPTDVAQTYLYNAPGLFGVVVGDVWGSIANALSPGTPITIPAAMTITNIIAADDVVSSVGLYVAPPVVLTVESQSPFGAHSIAGVTDTLAVYNLFATVDPSVSVETISGLLMAASNQAENSLESAVSSLGVLLVDGFTPRTGSEYDANRDNLYADLNSITSVLPQPSSLHIELFGTTAADGIAYRYADSSSWRVAA